MSRPNDYAEYMDAVEDKKRELLEDYNAENLTKEKLIELEEMAKDHLESEEV